MFYFKKSAWNKAEQGYYKAHRSMRKWWSSGIFFIPHPTTLGACRDSRHCLISSPQSDGVCPPVFPQYSPAVYLWLWPASPQLQSLFSPSQMHPQRRRRLAPTRPTFRKMRALTDLFQRWFFFTTLAQLDIFSGWTPPWCTHEGKQPVIVRKCLTVS